MTKTKPVRTEPLATSFSHVNLLVTDLERTRAFYVGQLGFEELDRPVGGQGAWFRVGALQLHVSVVEAMPPRPENGFPHTALHVPTDRFERSVEELRAAGVHIIRGAMAREDFGVTVWTAFCTDPDGNILELTDVGPLD